MPWTPGSASSYILVSWEFNTQKKCPKRASGTLLRLARDRKRAKERLQEREREKEREKERNRRRKKEKERNEKK